ncbi:MAG: M24 family metallopeptidase [Gaiellales bacterium]
MAEGVLIHGDSLRDFDLYLATGVTIGDPFTYLEQDGRRVVVASRLELDVARRDSTATEVWPDDEFGVRELIREGMDPPTAALERVRRVLERAGVDAVTVPPGFPVELSDYLRASGVRVMPDRHMFELRRRRKDDRALEGIRLAQRATEAAFAGVREMLGASSPGRDGLQLDGETLTCERVRAEISEVLRRLGCEGEPPLVGAGPRGALVHDLGSGPIHPGEPVIVDVFPRHAASRFCADMTRTFCFGEPPEPVRRMHAAVLDALRRSTELLRPGVSGRSVWEEACDAIEAGGYRTTRGLQPGETLDEDFFHGLGHGVGLEVHEPPFLGLGGHDLLDGDVVTIEPGVYRKDLGGVRLEDLVHVTDAGPEVLTEFSYELEVRP